MIAMLFQGVVPTTPRRARDAIVLGVVVGLAAAQHPITVIALPGSIACALHLLGDPRRRIAYFLLMAAAFSTTTVALYASLPLLRTSSAWPNWGDVDSPAGILRHALRTSYGTWSLAANVDLGSDTVSGMTFFVPLLGRTWNVFLLLVPIGAIWLWPRRRPLLVLSAMLALGVAFLLRARLEVAPWNSEAVLERFDAAALIPLSVLLGLGVAAWRNRWQASRRRFLVDGVVAGFAVFSLTTGWARSDASRDNTVDLYQRALAATLPAEAVYVSRSDLELFHGLPLGTRFRYPVDRGPLEAPWYQTNVIPHVAPDLVPLLGSRPDEPDRLEALVASAYEAGREVVSTRQELVDGHSRIGQLQGLYFAVHPSIHSALGGQTVVQAVRLCPFIEQLRALPEQGHGFSRRPFGGFVRAFEGAWRVLVAAKLTKEAALADTIGHALAQTREPDRWREGCRELTRLMTQRKPPASVP
jgi:hypothetical protein